ncbi:DUF2190 family protein [Malikia spinosa]|uniref:DUF2190 family protein n=1 Tax=Malikia spinosa TaxID=86180 RepID=UPI002FDA592B
MENYNQTGAMMDYTASSNIVSGQVVAVGNMLGVASGDIASGAVGVLKMQGEFIVPKVSAAVIAQGETLSWDASAGAFDDNLATPASGDITGSATYARESAGNGVTSMLVMFTNAPGTRTA